jgi:hypothetical protein
MQNGYAQQPAQPMTNKIYVASLDDAMIRYASPNSTMVYILQDESTLFEIYTDPMGKKSARARKLVEFSAESAPSASGGEFVTRKEFDELAKKFEALTARKETDDNV